MKYKSFSILFLAVSLSLGHITFSAWENGIKSTQESWWMKNLPEASIIAEVNSVQSDLYELAYSEQRFSNIVNTFQESRKLLWEKRQEIEAYIEKIDEMQSDIESNMSQSDEQKNQIERDILLLEKEIKLIKIRQEDTKTYIRKILVDGYKAQKREKTDIWLYGILFEKTFGAHLSEKDSLNILQNSASQLLERQKSIEYELTQLGWSLSKKFQAKKRIMTRLEGYKEELQNTQEMKKEILSETIAEQSLQRKIEKVTIKKQSIAVKIETKFAEYEKNLLSKVSKYNCETQRSSVCVWIRGYIKAEKELITNGGELTSLDWPVNPDKWFWYHFRDQKYFTQLNEHHTWLDILVDPSTPIKSMGNGYILMKQIPNSNSPGLVIIKHLGSIMSMYIGIVPNELPLFSRISTGGIIGTSREYTEHSGKNNVHIELYENGFQIDPLDKMDMSGLHANIIPARYWWKYIDDLSKNTNEVNIPKLKKQIGFFHLEGENEAERQQSLLDTFASSDFQDRNIWVEESIAESIDPTFILCVGLAESTLGKNLTTEGNIGNVWNTDSGARRKFDGPRAGIRAISAVVNNRFLWKYLTIDQLSGWGNPVGPIYASSQTNWHENIVKCMSAIKGKYVWNKSNFRLSKASLLMYQREWFSRKISE